MEADNEERAVRLQQAQDAWLTYLELECDQQRLAINGTLAGVVASGCRLEITAARATALYDQLRDLRREL
jgi:uncharacterized protein YecT (DUF1311 family)